MSTWTDPKTWTAGDVLTAAEMNTYVRDNVDFVYTRPSARAYKDANSTISTATWTAPSLTGEEWDTDGIHDVGDPKKFTIPSGMGGRWRFDVLADWAYNASYLSGIRSCRFLLDGATGSDVISIQDPNSNNANTLLNFTHVLNLTAGQYVEVQVRHTEATSITLASLTVTATFEGG